MKILTILIFSGDRFHVNGLLKDITKINQKNLDIRLVDWTENKEILKKKKKIYSYYQKKLNNFKIFYQKGSYEFKYSKFITKFKSKYILLISDDDRLCSNNFPKIFKYLRFDFSGITMSFNNFENYKDLKKKYYDGDGSVREFNIYKDINRIGFISCQIIKTNLIQKIYKKEKNNLLITQFPQNFIILRIIREFQKWKVLNLNCIFNRVGNLELYSKNPKKYLDRLKSEYRGYLTPIKNNFKHLKKNEIKEIYKIIFFKNIISWLFLSIKYCGKINTFKDIKEVRKIIDEPYIIKFTLIIFYISPIFFLNFIRIIRKNFNKVINNK
jgi:hypothetical protein